LLGSSGKALKAFTIDQVAAIGNAAVGAGALAANTALNAGLAASQLAVKGLGDTALLGKAAVDGVIDLGGKTTKFAVDTTHVALKETFNASVKTTKFVADTSTYAVKGTVQAGTTVVKGTVNAGIVTTKFVGDTTQKAVGVTVNAGKEAVKGTVNAGTFAVKGTVTAGLATTKFVGDAGTFAVKGTVNVGQKIGGVTVDAAKATTNAAVTGVATSTRGARKLSIRTAKSVRSASMRGARLMTTGLTRLGGGVGSLGGSSGRAGGVKGSIAETGRGGEFLEICCPPARRLSASAATCPSEEFNTVTEPASQVMARRPSLSEEFTLAVNSPSSSSTTTALSHASQSVAAAATPLPRSSPVDNNSTHDHSPDHHDHRQTTAETSRYETMAFI